MLGNLHDGVFHKKYIGNTAAGQDGSAVASSAIATAGFKRIRVVIELGAVTSNAVLKASVSACDTSSGSFVDIASLGTDGFVATGKSDNTVIIDAPLDVGCEFVKINYQRTTANIELDAITFDLYDARVVPVTQDTTVAKVVAL